jgi:chromate transport protein ChrA
MKDKLIHIIRTKPIFLFMLPPFFVLHGFRENFDFIPAKEALLLTVVYMGASIAISLLFRLLYRNFTKANLVAFSIMAFNLFFGSAHDFIRKILPGSFITKYIFILPAAAVLLIVLLIVLKKRKSPLYKLSYFLNILFIVLLLTDAVLLTGKIINRKKTSYAIPEGFVSCNNCSKPDIYFILADEYAGNKELKDLFQFDDSPFINQLNKLNFHTIPESNSNYNYTPFSVASILNMEYLDLEGKDRNKPDLTYCYELIRDNKLLQFLRSDGYHFFNYSVFDFDGQPARTIETFLPAKTRLITTQTFLSRFNKEIRFNLVSRWRSKKNLKIITYYNKNNNGNIYSLTWKLAEQKTSQPKFVYAHLMMPHYPYYFDRNGKEQPFEKLLEGNQSNKEAYIEYLNYSNKKIIELVQHILQSSASPPIIVLAGDHGFRHFNEQVESKYYFLNLVSVHLPSKNYTNFSDSLTGVNLFRAVLNAQYGQQLPFLKDSTSYLKD